MTLLVGYTPAQYAIMASDLPLAWRSRRGRYRDRQRTRRQPAIVIQVHEGTLGHKGVLFLGRGDRRVVHPSGQGSAQIRRCRPNSAALDLHELVVDPVVNRSGAMRMVTNSGDRIIHHRQTFRSSSDR